MDTNNTFNVIKEVFLKDVNNLLDLKQNVLKREVIEYENFHFKFIIISCELFNNDTEIDLIKYLFSIGLSFDSLSQDLISNSNKYNTFYNSIFKTEYILRYSKTYNSIILKVNVNFIERFKNKTKNQYKKYIIKNKEIKYFTINKNNKVKIFKGSEVKYLSFKNFKKFNNYITMPLTLIKLLQIHLNSNINVKSLVEKEIFVSNKIIYKHNSIDDVLLNIKNDFKLENYKISDKINLLEILSFINKKMHYEFFCFFEKYYHMWNLEQKFYNFKKKIKNNIIITVSDKMFFALFFLLYYYKIIIIQEDKCFFSYMSINKIKNIDSIFLKTIQNNLEINKVLYCEYKSFLIENEINNLSYYINNKNNNEIIVFLKKFNFYNIKLINKKELKKTAINYLQNNHINEIKEQNYNGIIFFEVVYKKNKFLIVTISKTDNTYGNIIHFLCYFNLFDSISNDMQMEILNIVANLKIKDDIKVFEKEVTEPSQKKTEHIEFNNFDF